MERPATKIRKRIREACEPCRRKKGRCPGEKPVCSLCARLGQTCTYAGGARASNLFDGIEGAVPSYPSTSHNFVPETEFSSGGASVLEGRVQNLDDKVTEVLNQVRSLTASQAQPQSHPRVSDAEISGNVGDYSLPTLSLTRKAAELYLQFCHCQPLPLFSPNQFVNTLDSKEVEVRLCVAGLSLRFDRNDRLETNHQTEAGKYLELAKPLVMKRVIEGHIELSTLQCLCLLALIDFNDGQPQKAGLYLSLATEISRSARLDVFARHGLTDTKTEEHVRTIWSIVMLQYLSGSFGSMTTSVDVCLLRHPPRDASNALASVNRQNGSYSQEGEHDLGIFAYATQMSEVWCTVRRYVHHRGKLDRHPPWSGKSIYSSIMFRQMELESQMPHRHRFTPSGFGEHAVSVLSTNRHYWAPWLYLQIIYHTIVCTLNHPLLLSMHLRRFRVNQVPELFLQHTADLITSHTDWIIHLLEIAKEKQFQFSDPFLGQCIAIVATIFMQQSYTEDQEARLDKRAKFSLCLQFVQDLGRHWTHVNQMAFDLQQFERMVSRAYESSSYDHSPNLSKPVDLTTFWKILDNTFVPATHSDTKSIYGVSLTLNSVSRPENDVLSTRLLPEPTRVHSLPHPSFSTITTPFMPNGYGPPTAGSGDYNSSAYLNTVIPDLYADTPFLAQNFFALGQDFVGNADDWFNWTDP